MKRPLSYEQAVTACPNQPSITQMRKCQELRRFRVIR